MKTNRWSVALLCFLGAWMVQGCHLLLIGAAAGAGAGTVSYVGNELRVTQEVTVDRAWDAAHAAVRDLEFVVIPGETRKDATGGVLTARNAKDQPVKIQLLRLSERLTEIRIRVGIFSTAANRAAAQLLYDKMKLRM